MSDYYYFDSQPFHRGRHENYLNVVRAHLPGEYTAAQQIGAGIRDGRFGCSVYHPSTPHPIAGFQLVEMPHCCGICISGGAYVATKFQGRGLGRALNRARIEIARFDGFACMLATTTATNDREMSILLGNGWTPTEKRRNPRTGNEIILWRYEL